MKRMVLPRAESVLSARTIRILCSRYTGYESQVDGLYLSWAVENQTHFTYVLDPFESCETIQDNLL